MIAFFISTWPCENGLSQSTVHPHLEQLAADDRISRIIYVSVEEKRPVAAPKLSAKVDHAPVTPSQERSVWPARVASYLETNSHILKLAVRFKPDFTVCRGAPAGIYGARLKRKQGIPFYVESFEPHADYMLRSGVWSKFGLKYLVQKHWENVIKDNAKALITVSEGYARYLVEAEGVDPRRVFNVPCWVDVEKIRFDPNSRRELRAELHIDDAIACVYLGKFGGLYYDREAFEVFRILRETVGRRLFVLTLTPADRDDVLAALYAQGFDDHDLFVSSVPHDQIARYLSAADMAISFHRSSEWAFSFSPIKHGEYWACGLPTIIPEGVGDESTWVEAERAGAVANMMEHDSVRQAATDVLDLLDDPIHRERIRQVAIERRSKATLVEVYDKVLHDASSFAM